MKNASASALDVTGSGARTGKYVAEYRMPTPTPMMIWNPIDVARAVSSVTVLISPTPTMTSAHAVQSCGRYRRDFATLTPAMIAMGPVEKQSPKRSMPDAVGEASLHAW